MEALLLLIFVLVNLASSVSAWALTWTNADGKSYVIHQSQPVDCEEVQQAKGEEFRWSPEEDGFSIWLFENNECAGYRAGYSPPSPWNRVSSRELLSFRVALQDANNNLTSTSTSNSTSTATTSTTSQTITSTETTSTPTPSSTEIPTADASSSDDSSVPVGAVVGGVIGGVAGLAAVGALFFFLGRRRRPFPVDPAPRESGPDTNTESGYDPASLPAQAPMNGATGAHDPSSYEGKLELDSAPIYQATVPDELAKQSYSPLDAATMAVHRPPSTMMAELPGDEMMAEMSDTHRLNELEGDGRTKR
ncbi:hypothetical protein BJX76DRAFT_355557 [Aspergillus varians]